MLGYLRSAIDGNPAQPARDALVSDDVLTALIRAVGSVFTGIMSVVVLVVSKTMPRLRHYETRVAVDAAHELVDGKMSRTHCEGAGIGPSHR